MIYLKNYQDEFENTERSLIFNKEKKKNPCFQMNVWKPRLWINMQSIFLMAHFPHIKFDVKFNHIYCAYVSTHQTIRKRREGGVKIDEMDRAYFQFQLLWSRFYYISSYFFFTFNEIFKPPKKKLEMREKVKNEIDFLKCCSNELLHSHIYLILWIFHKKRKKKDSQASATET